MRQKQYRSRLFCSVIRHPYSSTLLEQADELGLNPSKTNLPQCRINYALKRTALRVLCGHEHEGQGRVGSMSQDLSLSDRSGEGGAVHAASEDSDDFQRRVQVGVTIEAEMDNTMGGTEWVQGQVRSLNAARCTFTVRFKVQNDKETGEWIEEYHWDEMGKEWRFATSDSDVGRAGAKAQHGSAKSSSQLRGVTGAERVDPGDRMLPHKASGDEDVANAAGSKAAMAELMRKVRAGAIIEAEMDDSNGGVEWIQGVVQMCKKATQTFTVKFAVTNDEESGEWTEEYRFFAPPPHGPCLSFIATARQCTWSDTNLLTGCGPPDAHMSRPGRLNSLCIAGRDVLARTCK